ncbi:hypothetical protein G6546_06170 [Citrobacter portucalensis]|uniref:hypothetical protein n=1 Tax=Citrobacter TaxID=544 RepID=UPI00044D87D2|nr:MULTISPECIES: hypothetical protein [Citrobacter]MBD0808516.1 hypothetical protein [Citrobacter sp. C13]MBJ9849801.1 hypothetical protein [Citrobacter freundii]ETX61134.1 hypothetical protein P835_04508 [Citrobacter portucalensis]KAA0537712.1 hypothetical protein F0328_23210 [Citrobacter portucalensis]MCX9007055.1 hypothetical protein [Citrobacter portucalensis]
MKRLFFFIPIIFISFDAMATCEIQPKNHACLTIFTKGTIYSAFPILNNKPEWKWYQSEDIGEYYWQTELGTCKNNKFVPNGARLLINLGTLRPKENPPTEGSFQDLLNAAEKTAFFDDAIVDNNIRSHIRGGFYQKNSRDSALFAILDNSIMVTYFKAEKSTYARMTAHLPEKNESYECVTKIEYGVLRSEKK